MRKLLLSMFVSLGALVLCACADVSSRAIPDTNVLAVLDGTWLLDRKASDDVRARLMPLFERNEAHWRHRAEAFDEPPPGLEAPPQGGKPDGGPGGNADRDDGISTMRWMQHERQKEVQSLIAILSPAGRLTVQHKDNAIRIMSDKGEGTRSLTIGEQTTLFVSIGGFVISPRWEKGALVIDARGTSGNNVRIVERYVPKGDEMTEMLEIKVPTIGKQSFHMLYRREGNAH